MKEMRILPYCGDNGQMTLLIARRLALSHVLALFAKMVLAKMQFTLAITSFVPVAIGCILTLVNPFCPVAQNGNALW